MEFVKIPGGGGSEKKSLQILDLQRLASLNGFKSISL